MPESETLAPKQLLRAQKLAHLNDNLIAIPFTRIRFGWDSIIGLIPGIGDLSMLFISSYIIILAKQMGVPARLLVLMLRNCLIDFALGLLPFIGDLIDVFYKANTANVKIMQNWWLSEHQNEIRVSTEKHLSQWRGQ